MKKMLNRIVCATALMYFAAANGAVSVTASRDYVDRKIAVVSNQLDRIESRTNIWNSAIQGVKVNSGEPLTPVNNIVDITVPTQPSDIGAVPTSREINGYALNNDITLTGADIAVSNSDTNTVDMALDAKLDKSGGIMTGGISIPAGEELSIGGIVLETREGPPTSYVISVSGHEIELPISDGTFALLENIAPGFNTNITYVVDQLVTKDNQLQICTEAGEGTNAVFTTVHANIDYLLSDIRGDLADHAGNTDVHVTTTDKAAWNAKYDLPIGGITTNDLASTVRESLGKADSAIQGIKVNGGEQITPTNSIVNITVPVGGDDEPEMASGNGSAGSSEEFSRSDHIHPAETRTEVGYYLPSTCFPITYYYFGVEADPIVNSQEVIITSHENGLLLSDTNMVAICWFDNYTKNFTEVDVPAISNLLFNSIAPEANVFPALEQGTVVYVRDIAVSKVGDVPIVPVSSVNSKTGAVVLKGSDIKVSDSNTNTIDVALSDLVHQIAPEWIPNSTNIAHKLVSYQGVLYENTSGITIANSVPPSTSGSGWTARPVSDIFLPLTGGEMTGWLGFVGNSKTNYVGNFLGNLVVVTQDSRANPIYFPTVSSSSTLAVTDNLPKIDDTNVQDPDVVVAKLGYPKTNSYTFTHQSTTSASEKYTRAGFSMRLSDYLAKVGYVTPTNSVYHMEYVTIDQLKMYLSTSSSVTARLQVRERTAPNTVVLSNPFTIGSSIALSTITFPSNAKFSPDKAYDFWFTESSTSNVLASVSIYLETNYPMGLFEVIASNGTRIADSTKFFRGNSTLTVHEDYSIDLAKEYDTEQIETAISDLPRAYTLWSEPLAEADQAGGYNHIFITPSAFGASANCIIRSLVLKTSGNADQLPNRIVYAKIKDPANNNVLAISRPLNIKSASTQYALIFDDSVELTYTKQYRIDFESDKGTDALPVNIAIRLSNAQTSAQDIYYGIFNLRRPIIKVLYSDSSQSGYYIKPTSGIPATDLVSTVQTSLSKADSSIQGVKRNGTTITPTNGVVNVIVPTQASDVCALGNTGNQTLSGDLTLDDGGAEKALWFTSATDRLGLYISGGRSSSDQMLWYWPLAGVTDNKVLALLSDMYAAVQQIAPEWVANSTNEVNSLVSYNGVVYQNTSSGSITNAVPPSASGSGWTAKKVSELFLPLTGGEMSGDLLLFDGSSDHKLRIENNDAPRQPYIEIRAETIKIGNDFAGPHTIRIPYATGTLALLQNLAPNFSTSATYAEDQLVVKDNAIMRCIGAGVGNAATFTNDNATVEYVLSQIASSLNGHTTDDDIHVTTSNKNAWNAKYDLPAGGITTNDLASTIVTSLGKADTSIQGVKVNNGDPLTPVDGVVNVTIPTNLAAAEGGTDTSLVTTGDKYIWNHKQDALSATDLGYIADVPNKAEKYYTEIVTNSTTGVVTTNEFSALYGNVTFLTNNTEFVSAVKAVPITPDPEDVEELSEYGSYGTVGAALLGLIAAVAALKRGKADKGDLRYDIGTNHSITTASEDTSGESTVYYGAASLLDRTLNRISVTAHTVEGTSHAISELRLTLPAAESGKVRDFELRLEVGGQIDPDAANPGDFFAVPAPTIVPVNPDGETITLENPNGVIPDVAAGITTAKGVTMLYFSETAPHRFSIKGEIMQTVS